jgi:hypothetical protein
VNGQNKIVSLTRLDETSSEHSSWLRSLVLLQPPNRTCCMCTRSQNHPTCAFDVGSRPTIGQKKGEEEGREKANKKKRLSMRTPTLATKTANKNLTKANYSKVYTYIEHLFLRVYDIQK